MHKLETLFAYLADRAAEPSTWQGVAFILTLIGSKYADLDWGQAASIGATVSAAIKIIFPDMKTPTQTPVTPQVTPSTTTSTTTSMTSPKD